MPKTQDEQRRANLDAWLAEQVGSTFGRERAVQDAQRRANRGLGMVNLDADTTAEGRLER